MRFFISCPANLATGGTELLHQLSWHLSSRGVENYMLYSNANPAISPTPEVFAKYQVQYAAFFVDDESSVLICPETMIEKMYACTKGIVIIWWLSVNNYFARYQDSINNCGKMDIFELDKYTRLIHFVQSNYAYEFLDKNITLGSKEIFYLTDYINDEIIHIGTKYKHQTNRKDIVLYNPKKGIHNLKHIRELCRADIQWIPLQGLTPDQMAKVMCSAKVYIDFGAHPGKDRIPREAAVCGCCIITNREGSAANEEDVRIPEKYKISNMRDYAQVLDIIYDLVDNYEQRQNDFEAYAASVLGEKEDFEKEIDNMLKIINEKDAQKHLPWRGERYDALINDIQELVTRIHLLYRSFHELYLYKEIDEAISELLKIENVLSTLRETNYMIIQDALAEDN